MSKDIDSLADIHELGIEVAGIGLGSVDYQNDEISLDDRAATLFDLPANVPIARDTLHARIHKDDRPEIDDLVACLLDPGQRNIISVQHRVVHDDGKVLWLSARKKVKFSQADHDGKVVPLSGLVAIIDITNHKLDQQHIQYLLDELNHRSKNLLTVVQSLARRTFVTGSSETFLDRFSDRITGLVRNQDALVKGGGMQTGLMDLIASHLRAFARIDSPRVSIKGPEVHINAGAAQAIGMAIHELATNATKYGALSNTSGQVDIRWTVTDTSQPNLVIKWVETKGPEVQAPTHAGFGQKVIREMTASVVNGSVDLRYHPEGVRWELTMPLHGR